MEGDTDAAILAHTIFPTPSLCLDEKLYFRPKTGAWYSYKDRLVHIPKGGVVDFDTYFNAFSLGKWQNHTVLTQFRLRVHVEGALLIRLFHVAHDHTINCIAIQEHEGKSDCVIEIPPHIKGGLLYFSIEALQDSLLYSAVWESEIASSRQVKLGLVITTFKREEAVRKSSERIAAFLRQSDIDAHLIVVDNGKSAQIAPSKHITFIQNENLGGSGGFARGLFHLKEEAEGFTHALFMDDDASCESEAIYRTYRLLEYADDSKLAVAGAMLMGEKPNIQWENGAKFRYRCHPLKSGYDLHNLHRMLENEMENRFDYGGWWFFAFPIEHAHYPFPFFVRGDDIDFGLQRQFHQITMNAIASWGDDFFYKESPLTQYLDLRSHLLHHIQIIYLPGNFMDWMRVVWRFLLRYGLSYRYASVEAQLEAIRDVLKGPDFWRDNIDMQHIFPKISPLNAQEKLHPIDLSKECEHFLMPHQQRLPSLHRTMRLLKAVTLNGHLVPTCLFKRDAVIIPKTDPKFGLFFLRKEVCLYHFPTKEGVRLRHDKRRFFRLMREGLYLSWQLFKNRKRLRHEYRKAYPYLTSKAYWESRFFPDAR